MTGKVNFVLFVLWLSETGSSSLFNRPFDIWGTESARPAREEGQEASSGVEGGGEK